MQNLIQRSLALLLALGTLTIASATIHAAPSQQDDEGNGVIEGYVFLDDDGDGTLDLDEPGIGSITVRLEGEVEREVETDVAGGYGFFDLPDGDYEVIVEPGDDYATAELDRNEVTIEGEQVRRLDFALAEVDDEDAADEEDESAADEDMDEDDSDMDDGDADEADDEDMDDDSGMDEADMASESDATEMSVVVQQLIDAMGEDASEAEIRMALESALAAARADGTESELTAAIEMALEDMDEDESADDAADDADDEDMDDADDSDMDEEDMDEDAGDDADDSMAGDATGGAMTKGGKPVYDHEPKDMPNTGAGGPMSFGLILVLLLAGLAFVGRGMERRQQI